MQVEWYGQSAFRLTAAGSTVFIDPFGDLSPLAGRGMQFDYPPIESVVEMLVRDEQQIGARSKLVY